MPNVKSKQYRKFLDKGIIDILTKEDIKRALKNVKGINGKYIEEGRALLVTLYLTGARPVEALELVAKDFTKVDSYLVIQVQAAKKGVSRPIYIPYRLSFAKLIWEYVSCCFSDAFVFYHYKGEYKRVSYGKNNERLERIETSDKLRYHVKKWFKGVVDDSITTYFLRHNRFSQLAQEGVTIQDIMFLKGAKSIESVRPYVHLSTKKAKELAKKIK